MRFEHNDRFGQCASRVRSSKCGVASLRFPPASGRPEVSDGRVRRPLGYVYASGPAVNLKARWLAQSNPKMTKFGAPFCKPKLFSQVPRNQEVGTDAWLAKAKKSFRISIYQSQLQSQEDI
jgi:hypothetical protein